MKRTAAILAGIALAGGTAWAAAQEAGSEQQTRTLPEGETAYGAEIGEQTGHDVSQMSPEELTGMPVLTTAGEEVGSINQVGYRSTDQEKVATINVGSFLGVGEKLIAVPLSELRVGSDDSLQTTMTREEIQAQPEFDPSTLTTDQAPESEEQDW